MAASSADIDHFPDWFVELLSGNVYIDGCLWDLLENAYIVCCLPVKRLKAVLSMAGFTSALVYLKLIYYWLMGLMALRGMLVIWLWGIDVGIITRVGIAIFDFFGLFTLSAVLIATHKFDLEWCQGRVDHVWDVDTTSCSQAEWALCGRNWWRGTQSWMHLVWGTSGKSILPFVSCLL